LLSERLASGDQAMQLRATSFTLEGEHGTEQCRGTVSEAIQQARKMRRSIFLFFSGANGASCRTSRERLVGLRDLQHHQAAPIVRELSRSGAKSLGVLTPVLSIIAQADCGSRRDRRGIGLRLLLLLYAVRRWLGIRGQRCALSEGCRAVLVLFG
jgi:hypothetical protein